MANHAEEPDGKVPEVDKVELDDEVSLDPAIQAVIGRALNAYTQDIVNAPVPDRFFNLLAQLEAKEREKE